MFSDKAKAFVAAGVALVGSYVTAKFGFAIPEDAQIWVTSLIFSVVSGFLTYLVPNKIA